MRIGLIVNPIAGMGGRVALKGTDGTGTAARAAALGASPVAGERARRFLARLARSGAVPELLTVAGGMGADAMQAAGLAARLVPIEVGLCTCADDTRRAAHAMAEAGVECIVFAGGDGTARDLLDALGMRVPILGIPSGVKMHSAVFAASPEAGAGLIAMLVAGSHPVEIRDAEVMDVDEARLRDGAIVARLHGYARVPYERRLVQPGKAGGYSATVALMGAAREVVQAMEAGALYLIGPGTSAQLVKRQIGFEGTLLGVDAVHDGRLVGADVSEQQILALAAGRPLRIIVGLVGGQGFVFGRGNQQLSPEVIRRAGRGGITVLASIDKLLAFEGAPLLVDTGDVALDRELSGFIRIATGPGETTVVRIAEPPT